VNLGEFEICGGPPKWWVLGSGGKVCFHIARDDAHSPLYWSTEDTQAVIALGCPKPVPCEVCDGHGFYMVSAYGTVQEIECGECDGIGVKPPRTDP
jgi:hypothetical protein